MVFDSSFSRPIPSLTKDFKSVQALPQRTMSDSTLASFNKAHEGISKSIDAKSTSLPNAAIWASASNVERFNNLEKSLIEMAIIDHQTTLNHYKNALNGEGLKAAYSDRIKNVESAIENYKNQLSIETGSILQSTSTNFTA